MGFSLSAGVTVREFDLTLTIPALATSIGAIVGDYEWGPVDEFHLVSSEKVLAENYGLPNDTNYKSWFSAANFLSYSNALQLIRVIGTGTLNAVGGTNLTPGAGFIVGDGALTTSTDVVLNRDSWDLQDGALLASDPAFFGKYPGKFGNRIAVSAVTEAHFAGWKYEGEFDFAPVDADNDIWVAVTFDGTVVERFYANRQKNSVSTVGGTNYVQELINRTSKYIWCNAKALSVEDNDVDTVQSYDGVAPTTGFIISPVNLTDVVLAGGVSVAPISADYIAGWALFNDDESVDINLCMQGEGDIATGKHMIENVCQIRKDCIGFVSPDFADVVGTTQILTDILQARNTGYNVNSSYGVMDGNYKYQYDRYNDVYRWLPLNADIAGTCARTDADRDPWWSPGGLNRGQIKNVVKLAYNPTKAERDALYSNGINPIVSFKGEGTVLWGDKTMQTKPSAFDRINVRRLFIVLEKAIATASKYSLFEFNDRITRNNFVNMVEPFLRDVKGRRGVQDYLVVCDATNNTGEVIDRNEFVADIYIKPNRSINFISLNFVAVKSGVAFEEVLLTNTP